MPEPPVTGDAVVALVRRAEIADDDALAGFLTRSGPLPPTASDTATRLVQAGILTPFQARLILQGKHKGFRLGPYRILNQIGAGGMGQVFLAEHAALRRRVALKVLPPKRALEAENVDRFYREARAAAALDHPNIVHAYDVSCDRGTHFLVLEYIEGDTLDRLLAARGRLPVGEAVGYAVQAAAGLQHAHEKGVAHRDIKPSNLLVDRDGLVKVLDLGLAEFFVDTGTKLDRVAAVTLTTDYASPEQLLGADPDKRADIYNLGATLYHLLAGRVPFEGTTAAKMLAHHLADPARLNELRRDVPEPLAAIVARMMAKSADDRYQSAAEVVQALLPFVKTPDVYGKPSGKLPPLAAAVAQQSTESLPIPREVLDLPDVRDDATESDEPTDATDEPATDEVLLLRAELDRARQLMWLAVAGMVAGLSIGFTALVLAVL